MHIPKHPKYDPTQETVVIRTTPERGATVLLKGRSPRVFRNEAHATKYVQRNVRAGFRDNLLLDNYDFMERNA